MLHNGCERVRDCVCVCGLGWGGVGVHTCTGMLQLLSKFVTFCEQDNSAGSGGLVAAYGGGSESDDDIEDVIQEDRQHTNWAKLACLLCKRQFPTKESLIR